MANQVETEQYTYSVEDVVKQVLGDYIDYHNTENEVDECFDSLIENRDYSGWGQRGHADRILFKLTGREGRELHGIDFDHDPEIVIAGLIYRGAFKKMGEKMHPNFPRYILDRAVNKSITATRYILDHEKAQDEHNMVGSIIPSNEPGLRKLLRFQKILRAKNGNSGSPERR